MMRIALTAVVALFVLQKAQVLCSKGTAASLPGSIRVGQLWDLDPRRTAVKRRELKEKQRSQRGARLGQRWDSLSITTLCRLVGRSNRRDSLTCATS